MTPQDPASNRRAFIKQSATVAAAASVVSLPAQRAKAAADSNERMRIGFIGPGGRGFGAHVKSLCELHAAGRKIDLVGVAEVYSTQRNNPEDRSPLARAAGEARPISPGPDPGAEPDDSTDSDMLALDDSLANAAVAGGVPAGGVPVEDEPEPATNPTVDATISPSTSRVYLR